MAYSNDTRSKARTLYVHSRLTIPAISVHIDVPQATIARWKANARSSGDDWEIARASAVMADEGFERVVSEAVENFTVMFQVTMGQIQEDEAMSAADKVKLMAALTDSFNKMMSAAGRASPKLSKLGIATELLQHLADFVSRDFPQHQEAFLEILEPFGFELSGAYAE